MKSWPAIPLGDICEILDSRRKPVTKKDRRPGEYPYYGATGIVDYVDGFIFDEPLVLVGEDGAKWSSGEGTAFQVSGRYWVNNHAHVIRPIRTQLLDDWLIYHLVHEDLSPFVSGLTVPKLNQGSLREIPVPLPPVAEQRRIVAILDEAFEGIATAKANAEKNLGNAREVFESYLHSIFTQRGDGWVEKPLGEMVALRNGINFTKTSKGDSIKILGVKDFQNSYWAPMDALDSIIPDGVVPETDTLQENDIVFVRSNGNPELIGRCLLIGAVSERTTHSGFTIKARLQSSDVFAPYLCHFLKSGGTRKEMIDGGNGANIKSLNQGTLSRLVIPFPSLADQVRIVQDLEAIQGESQQFESVYQRKLEALHDLKKSLLDQAFSGAL